MSFGGRRSFDRTRLVVDDVTIRTAIHYALMVADKPMTAWQVAKEINALGSSVSSEMFKMRKAGLLREVGPLTKHGGRTYTL